MQVGSKLNGILKEIGQKKKVSKRTHLVYLHPLAGKQITWSKYLQNKEDASDLMEEKSALDKSKKDAEEHAVQKEAQRDRKIRTIGNYVHESVPVSNNEVSPA